MKNKLYPIAIIITLILVFVSYVVELNHLINFFKENMQYIRENWKYTSPKVLLMVIVGALGIIQGYFVFVLIGLSMDYSMDRTVKKFIQEKSKQN